MRYILLSLFFLPFTIYSQQLEKVSTSINQFGMDAGFYLAKSTDYLISPASISTAIGMTYLGAEGITKDQIKKVFYYPDNVDFQLGFTQYLNALENNASGSSLMLANKLWGGEGRIDLNPEFIRKNMEIFRSDLQMLDFDNKNETIDAINNWVAQKTNNNILDIITPDLLTRESILFLTNAIYFKSNWANKFDPNLTKKGVFKNAQNESLLVDFMSGKGDYQTYEDEEVNILELPYQGDEYSFVILLPKIPMAELENRMLIDNYNYWMRNMIKTKFELVQIPKFKSSSELKLKDMLTNLGMPSAFRGANLVGIGSADGNIEISEVIHKTFIEVNEEGTEAAAATMVGVVFKSAAPRPKKFIADRPFIYILRRIKTNSIIFIGKLSNPKY